MTRALKNQRCARRTARREILGLPREIFLINNLKPNGTNSPREPWISFELNSPARILGRPVKCLQLAEKREKNTRALTLEIISTSIAVRSRLHLERIKKQAGKTATQKSGNEFES